MSRKMTLQQYQDRYWELVAVYLAEAFGLPPDQAVAESESLRSELTIVRYVKRWKDIDIIYHECPFYLAFDHAVVLGIIRKGAGPDVWLAEHHFDHRAIEDEVIAGRSRLAALHEATAD